MTFRPKETSTTTLVLEHLKRVDDFQNLDQICDTVRVSVDKALCRHKIQTALVHLRRFRAIDSMESDGRLWFFATPDTDMRTYTVDEHASVTGRPGRHKGRKPGTKNRRW